MTGLSDPLPSRSTVRRDDVDLAVFEGGNPDGPTVLMVHGWPNTHDLWRHVAELLGADHRLVAYDTRGQGGSPTEAPDDAFTVDVLADDLMAVADAMSPDERVHLLAHDWGSVQVWEAVCRPGAEERIASFTSIRGPHLAHVSFWIRRTLGRPDPRELAGLVAQAASSSYIPFLVSPLAPPLLRLLSRDMSSGLRYYRANLRRGPAGPPDHLHTRVPVLQLELTRDIAVRHGSLAASDPWVETLERRRVPHGHWVALTHPGVVASEVERFVGAHPTR